MTFVEMPAEVPPVLPKFVQPKSWLRWLAVLLAVAGWYDSLHSFRVSAGGDPHDPLMRLVCAPAGPGQTSGCHDVLTSDYAYFPRHAPAGELRVPLGAFGMTYFGAIFLWYLFIGPPTRPGRGWHLLLLLVMLCGAAYSVYAIHIMANVLHRWCGSCLAAHAINALLLLVAVVAWPWRKPDRPVVTHPTARLALATVTAGVLLFVAHLTIVYLSVASGIVQKVSAEYRRITDDPAYVRFNYDQQTSVAIPLRADEVFAGAVDAPNTVVTFSDFDCPICRQLHETLAKVVEKHPGQLRIAFRYYPQDPECNSNPAFRTGGHVGGCRAARAAEAARIVGGREAYLAMRKALWDHQADLPATPLAQQSERERHLFEEWAVAAGLDRAAFSAAIDSPAAAARVQEDIELANRLGLQAMPVVYLNGRRLIGWSRPEAWDALLGAGVTSASQP